MLIESFLPFNKYHVLFFFLSFSLQLRTWKCPIRSKELH